MYNMKDKLYMPPKPKYRNIFKGKLLSDPDKDGYPTAVDCELHNSKKQGIGQFVQTAAAAVGGETKKAVQKKIEASPKGRWLVEKFKEYKENEPERRKAALEREQHNVEIMKLRRQSEMARAEIGERKMKLMERRQKAMPSIGGMGMPMGKPPSLMSPLGTPTKKKAKRRKRRKRKVRYEYV